MCVSSRLLTARDVRPIAYSHPSHLSGKAPGNRVQLTLPSPSIAVHNPQAPSRIQQHPHERRLHAPPQILRAAVRRAIPSHRARQRRHNRHPATSPTARVATAPRPAPHATPHATALIRLPPSRARAVLTRRLPAQERGFLANAAGGGSALRPRDVVLVQRELPPIDPGAETEVAGQDEEEAGEHAADDGADVGA